MKYFTLLTLLPLLSLAACTGTSESAVPVLLVVGYENAADEEGSLGLVEDTFNLSGDAREILFVPGSRRPLPAAPIAYDITGRSENRTTLVALSRDSAANGNAAFLNFFNVDGIDPDNPAAFERTGLEELPLNGDALDTSEFPLNLNFCPVDVQVSSEGRYAALLHDGEPCGLQGFAAVDIVDLRATPDPRLLARFSVQIIPSRFFLQQERPDAPGNRLYFFEDDPAGVQVTEVTLPDENANNPEIDTVEGGDNVQQVVDIPDDNQDAVDLGVLQDTSGENTTVPVLVALFEESFVTIRNYGGEGDAPVASARVDTTEQSRQLITDDFLELNDVFVLGEDEFTVHQTITADAEEEADIVAADAVYDPNNRFVYFALNETVSLFDPTNFDYEGDDDIEIDSFDVDEVTDPAFITWIQAVSDAPDEE